MSNEGKFSPAGVAVVRGDADAVMPSASVAIDVSTRGTSGEAGAISALSTPTVRPAMPDSLSNHSNHPWLNLRLITPGPC